MSGRYGKPQSSWITGLWIGVPTNSHDSLFWKDEELSMALPKGKWPSLYGHGDGRAPRARKVMGTAQEPAAM